jgi:hypothetical protein
MEAGPRHAAAFPFAEEKAMRECLVPVTAKKIANSKDSVPLNAIC